MMVADEPACRLARRPPGNEGWPSSSGDLRLESQNLRML